MNKFYCQLSAGILPQMVARKAGVVVNVGSSAGANQMALWAVYSATKVDKFSGLGVSKTELSGHIYCREFRIGFNISNYFSKNWKFSV